MCSANVADARDTIHGTGNHWLTPIWAEPQKGWSRWCGWNGNVAIFQIFLMANSLNYPKIREERWNVILWFFVVVIKQMNYGGGRTSVHPTPHVEEPATLVFENSKGMLLLLKVTVITSRLCNVLEFHHGIHRTTFCRSGCWQSCGVLAWRKSRCKVRKCKRN